MDKLDLSEGPYNVFGDVGLQLRDRSLSEADEACVFSHLNDMAESDLETRNLLVAAVLEILTDTPESVELARKHLNEPARRLFEKTLEIWGGRR